jgi:hypothetical protein
MAGQAGIHFDFALALDMAVKKQQKAKAKWIPA